MQYNENYPVFLKRFCANLKKMLERSGLTQRKQLLAGLDPRYIARIKKGEGNPTLMTLWRLCRATDADPERLFKKAGK